MPTTLSLGGGGARVCRGFRGSLGVYRSGQGGHTSGRASAVEGDEREESVRETSNRRPPWVRGGWAV